MPVVAGVSAWLISWAGDGVTTLNLAGLLAILGGVGWAATRAIFGTEKYTQEAFQELNHAAAKSEAEKLDQLDYLLSQDDDPRDQELLRMLRSQRAQFRELASQPSLVARSSEVLDRVEQLFRASVKNLAECYKLWEESRSLGRMEKVELMNEREKLLGEIHMAVKQVQTSLTEYKRIAKKAVGTDLSELRSELEASMEIAKKTEERLRELELSPGTIYQREAE